MSELQSHSEVEVSSERSFGLVFAGFFAIVACLPLLSDRAPRIWALVVAALFFAAAFLAPKALKPLNLLWFKLGMLLGRIVTPVVMFLVFFVAVLPTALIVRVLGKDPMQRTVDHGKASYWIGRSQTDDDASSMKNQF